MKNPKILYISCHSILEYDELRMFRDLEFPFLSLGAYFSPDKPCVNSRPPLEGCKSIDNASSEYHSMCQANIKAGLSAEFHDRTFTKKFLDCFDIILIMHIPYWIERNWEVLKGRNVIWRTIGQSTPQVENHLKKCRDEGLKIVRYSPMERSIPGYIGEDDLIRFGKYKNDFLPWNGLTNNVVTIGQSMKQRGWFCSYDTYIQVTDGFPAKLYGHGNEGAEIESYNELISILADNRVYFYTGTKPASYTLNFIEAAMAGIPIVSIGPQTALFEGHDYFEVPLLLEKYRSGFFSDSVDQMRKDIQMLLTNREIADYTSNKLHHMAIDLFDAEKIKEEWKRFFDGL